MKITKFFLFCFLGLLSISISVSAGSWEFVDVAGTNCKARTPSQAVGLQYKHYGELINASDEMITVVCDFPLPNNTKSIAYSTYVYGRGTTNTYGYVTCKLWVTNVSSGSKRNKEANAYVNENRRYRLMINDVASKASPTGGFDIVTLECFMDPDTTIQGMRLFSED